MFVSFSHRFPTFPSRIVSMRLTASYIFPSRNVKITLIKVSHGSHSHSKLKRLEYINTQVYNKLRYVYYFHSAHAYGFWFWYIYCSYATQQPIFLEYCFAVMNNTKQILPFPGRALTSPGKPQVMRTSHLCSTLEKCKSP